MSKIVLDDVISGYGLSKINENFQKIEDELNNKVLYRNNPVGEINTIEQDLDLNGFSLYNVEEINGVAVDTFTVNVDTVAENIDPINTVATNIANVNIVAGIDDDVSDVAAIANDVSILAPYAPDVGAYATGIYNNLASEDEDKGASLVGYREGENVKDVLDALQSSTGASRVGYQSPSGVVRDVAGKLDEFVSVKDFGAVGDGVTDDTAAIQAAFNACAPGGTVNFGKGETYSAGPLTSRNASVINLNGSTIVRRAPFSSGTLLTIQPDSVTYTGLSITVTENQNSFIASGIPVSVGDLLRIGSTDTSVGSYTHGQYAKVTAVVGSKIYISTPIYSAYTITSIRVYVGKASVSLVNGALDISQASEVAQNSAALTMIGSNLLIDGVTATGNYYTGYLFNLGGENAVIQRCHLNTCLNVLGDGGTGRVGYGVNCIGNNFNVRSCIFNDTKHAFTSASGSVMSIGLSLADSTIYESPTELPDPDYKGSIDLHSNVRGIFAIDNVRVFAEGMFLQNRAPSARVKISNSYFSQWKPNSIATQGVEVDLQGLVFRDCVISLASGGTLFPDTPTVNSTEVRDVLIDSCIITGGALAYGRMPLVDVTVRGCTLTQPQVIYITPLSGDKSWSGISFVDNHVVSAQALTLFTLVGGVSKKLVITGNKFLRTNTTSTSILQVKSTLSDSPASAEDINISGNSFEYLTGDTSGTDGLSFRDMVITRLNISNNFIKRVNANANAITLRNTSVYQGNLIGNNTDTEIVIYASPTAVTLSSFTVVGNTGESYKVSANLGSVTKVRYKFDTGSNNFTTVSDAL